MQPAEVHPKDGNPLLFFADQAGWEAWLAANHQVSAGIWLKLAKKDSGTASVDYPAALESALCYGWIDGQKAALNEQFWLQKFTPRKARSIWSKINREKVEALIAAGRMQPAGLRQVELARADGRWEAAYDSQSKIEVPEDFQRALEYQPAAKEFFATLDSTNRYAILHRIQTAIKPETRAARIDRFIEMLAKQQKLYP
jgi:uncharacterized protein YdeI (YjbR/CyaY-like superfamily)